MTKTEILALAASLGVSFVPVLIGVLLNNGRLNDVRELLRAEIQSAKAGASKEMAELRTLIDGNHSELLMRIAEIENRRVRP